MKRVLTYLFAAGMMISAASLMFTSCTKEGPQGPAGAAGQDGTDGQDANATCTQCHNFSDEIVAKIVQYDASGHGTGMSFERNGVDCAACHTSQGFREVIVTGADTTTAVIQNPVGTGCRTCHMIHDTYTATDWGLRTTDPIKLVINGETVDLGGSSNLCGKCHQSRKPSPYPELGKADVTITSSYWGPHYGSMAPLMASTGAMEIPGSESYDVVSAHKNVPCYTCHGGEAYGSQAGGHSFYMSYAYHGSSRANVAVCKGCHSSIGSNFDLYGRQTIIEELLHQLENQLLADSLIDETLHVVPGTYPAETAGIVMNYLLIHYDHSLGIHNFPYTKAVLVNSYEALMAK
ncbi:MAG: hypothetical protein HQ542_02495 [Bacteroidia bacterium]|nr:hypothetical protein [Bacteroidia bacterium]